MHNVAGITHGFHFLDHRREQVPNSFVPDDDEPFHPKRFRSPGLLLLFDFVLVDLVVEQTAIDLQTVGRFGLISTRIFERFFN